MYPHTIHLREPWTRVELDRGARFQRRFHCPTGLDANETVWIVIEEQHGPARVTLNRTTVGEFDGSGECEITLALEPHNEIVIDMCTDKDHTGVLAIGSVRLEIRL